MKKKFISSMFLFLTILSVNSFSNTASYKASSGYDNNEELSEVIETTGVTTEELSSIENYEITNTTVVEEKIIDNNVELVDGQLSLELDSLESKFVDENIIAEVEKNIEILNEGLENGELTIDENGEIVDSGLYEKIDGQAGKTKIVFTWKYIDVYFSTDVVQGIIWFGSGYLGSFCSGISSGIGTAACFGAAGFTAGYLGSKVASKYPRGMIFRMSGWKTTGFRSQ
jgi:hypothetical protein